MIEKKKKGLLNDTKHKRRQNEYDIEQMELQQSEQNKTTQG